MVVLGKRGDCFYVCLGTSFWSQLCERGEADETAEMEVAAALLVSRLAAAPSEPLCVRAVCVVRAGPAAGQMRMGDRYF